MEYDPEEVMRQAVQISKSALDAGERRAAFPEFAQRFPTLFDMCCAGSIDVTMLRTMLDVQSKVAKGKLTAESADEIVGVGLGKRYIVPLASTLPIPPQSHSPSAP